MLPPSMGAPATPGQLQSPADVEGTCGFEQGAEDPDAELVRLAILACTTPVAFVCMDGTLLECNNAFTQLLGCARTPRCGAERIRPSCHAEAHSAVWQVPAGRGGGPELLPARGAPRHGAADASCLRGRPGVSPLYVLQDESLDTPRGREKPFSERLDAPGWIKELCARRGPRGWDVMRQRARRTRRGRCRRSYGCFSRTACRSRASSTSQAARSTAGPRGRWAGHCCGHVCEVVTVATASFGAGRARAHLHDILRHGLE
jgi:hypothetical protein